MRESDSALPREVPGGARRADTFLLVVGTVLMLAGVIGFRNTRPPFIPLLFTALWLDTLARWLRRVRPQYARTAEYFGTLALGAALYAGWVNW